jgi:hypothetical protein
MFILKLLIKVILLPVFLLSCFISSWAGLLSKVSGFILGLFNLLLLMILIMYLSRHDWPQAAITGLIAFVAFMISFSASFLEIVMELITKKLSNIIFS